MPFKSINQTSDKNSINLKKQNEKQYLLAVSIYRATLKGEQAFLANLLCALISTLNTQCWWEKGSGIDGHILLILFS